MSTPEHTPVIATRSMNVIDPLTGVERSIREGEEVPLLLLGPYEAGEAAPEQREGETVHEEPAAPEPSKASEAAASGEKKAEQKAEQASASSK